MERVTLEYDRKNIINLILGSFWLFISGTLSLLASMMLAREQISLMYVAILLVVIGSAAGFIGIRWYYYNCRVMGHIPNLSTEQLRAIIKEELSKTVR